MEGSTGHRDAKTGRVVLFHEERHKKHVRENTTNSLQPVEVIHISAAAVAGTKSSALLHRSIGGYAGV